MSRTPHSYHSVWGYHYSMWSIAGRHTEATTSPSGAQALDDRYLIDRFMAEFSDRSVEDAYQLAEEPSQRRELTRAAVVAIVGLIVYQVVDLVRFGFDDVFAALLVIRLCIIAAATVLIVSCRQSTDTAKRYLVVTLVEAVIFVGVALLFAFRPNGSGVQGATLTLIILAVFVIIRNRLIATLATAVLGSAAWLLIVHFIGGTQSGDRVTQVLLLGSTITVGYVASLRAAIASRREFAFRLKDRETNERLSKEIQSRRRAEADLVRKATIDDLTKVANRRHFYEVADDEVHRAQRSKQCVSFLVLDVDHFKAVNDTHGHGAGDDVLSEIAKAIVGTVRRIDVVGRLGGEEFAVVMPGADLERAAQVAERIRSNVAQLRIEVESGCVRPTMSIGVTDCDPWTDRVSDAIRRADDRMYLAKESGRDRVVASDRNLLGSSVDGPAQ